MTINWYGQSCFKIQEGQRTVLLDPYSPKKYGLRGPQFKASVILVTDSDDIEETQKKKSEKSFLVSGPGEYEIQDIIVYGVLSSRDKEPLTVYHFEIGGIKFGALGEINRALTDEELEALDGVEVLFVPVGGKTAMNNKGAIEIINALEPKLAIPSCFKIPKLRTDLFSIESFLKEVGKKQVEKASKLSLKASSLPREGTKIVVLEPGG
ncbi:MBL fold metallo-hydrolase [Patescibacteria group bacterium AH-259-L07]|nr:MBL fold metallo-hydrolase [Patescibacteria group bacterium AH-259-L07]